jgi:superfamily I DNA and/or RNA helicase
LAERYVGNVHLQGHYRSESLALIDFSNRYFYGGKLQLVPNLQMLNKNEKALEFVKVEGVWDKNENLVEAKKVAELVLDLSQSNPSVSIGVITFNAPQQSLVLDEVDELFTSHRQTVPENLFVKNIENVQGDERDIIIFSIGYAPDKNGKVNVQFGSLNQQGGENRLNVAVSRAKKKVMVVCSVWPNQLDVSQTKNDGPKLLKKYLEYVNEVSERILPPRKDVVANSDKLWSTIKRDYQNMAIHLLDQSIPSHDLTVMKNSEYVSAILTDDDNYCESLSAKALHAQSLQLLEKNNWPYKRLYSRNFWQDRERFMLEVERFLNG